MTYAYPQYWRDMVKHGLNCTDEYADVLLNWESVNSNGMDTSEADWDELDAYWKTVDREYQNEKR
jgi:hypothetical protein